MVSQSALLWRDANETLRQERVEFCRFSRDLRLAFSPNSEIVGKMMAAMQMTINDQATTVSLPSQNQGGLFNRERQTHRAAMAFAAATALMSHGN